MSNKQPCQNDAVQKATQLAIEGLYVDGGHHKQWFLEQVLRALGADVDHLYAECEWEEGIQP